MKISHGSGAGAGGVTSRVSLCAAGSKGWSVQPKAVRRAAVRTTVEERRLAQPAADCFMRHARIFINAASAYTCCPHLRQARPSPSLEDGFTLARGRPPSRTLKIYVI